MDFDFQIKPLKESDIDQAIVISDKELGTNYITSIFLQKLIHYQNTLLIGAFNKKSEIIGYGYCIIYSKKEFQTSLHPSQLKMLPNILINSEKIGVTNTISIQKEYKNKGIGSAIFNQFLLFFKANSVKTISAFAWKNKNVVNMESIFKKYNFSILQKTSNFWFQESIDKNYNCPACKNPPCTCEAIIYFKELIQTKN